MSNLGKFIEHHRKNREMSISELARVSKVSRPYLSQVETGKRNTPSIEILVNISDALNLNFIETLVSTGYLTETDLLNYFNKELNLDEYMQRKSVGYTLAFLKQEIV